MCGSIGALGKIFFESTLHAAPVSSYSHDFEIWSYIFGLKSVLPAGGELTFALEEIVSATASCPYLLHPQKADFSEVKPKM